MIAILKFVTLITAITGFFRMNVAFPWDEKWTDLSGTTFWVIALMVLIAFAGYYIMKFTVYSRRFKVGKNRK